jgi:hypothetical protein
MIKQLIFGAGILFAGGIVQAASITWGSASGYVDTNDVSTLGSLVEAANACGEAGAYSPLINGVLFTARTDFLTGDTTGSFLSGDSGDTDYNAFLNSLDYGSSQFTVGGGQLESGKEYLIQLWYVDERSNSAGDRSMAFGDGNGNESPWVDDGYVTGTFTASDASQTITIQGYSNSDSNNATAHFSGYQLRDLSSPVPTLSTTAGESVFTNFTVNVSFSESVTGLTAGDFTVVNGVASSVSGSDSSWTVTIIPTGNGDVTVSLPAGVVIDGNSHGNVAGNTVLTTYVAPGSSQPVPTLSTATNKVEGSFAVQVAFSEPVTGLALSDFVVSGGTVSGLTGSGANYSVVVNPNFGGDVMLSLPKNTVTDLDGDNHKNVASAELVTAYYVTATVNSPAALLPYLTQDNVTATLSPGTYTITAADVNGTFGTPRFAFWGSNSTYDFTGVTINFAADIYTSDLSMNHMQIFGNDNVLKNLTMVDLCDVNGSVSLDGGVNLIMDGRNNRVEGFHMTIKGSYPYGYGDCFGKGATWTIKHSKHSGFLVRGESNHAKNCTLIQRSYGHCMFMQAASNPIIEGCYIEGEMRSTDDMLLEAGTESAADLIDFMTVWGYTLPPGYMKSLTEAGIRAYNAGNTYIDGIWYSRGTSNPTIIDNTMKNTRVGVTLTHATGIKYVSGCTAIGTERGYAIGSGVIENCKADVQYGPAFGVDYDSDKGITADITIIPYEGEQYNGSHHFAYIFGSDHNLTFRGLEENVDQSLEINVGGDLRIGSSYDEVETRAASNIKINNYTGYPLVLDSESSSISGYSIGTVTNSGTGNSIAMKTWNVTSNITFYGEATQSSVDYDSDVRLWPLASLAIDQNTEGDFDNESVTRTESEYQPWWRLDLKAPVDISEIRIWGRTDASQSLLSNYDLTVLDGNGQVVWTSYQADYPDPMVSLNTGSVTGQVVMLQLRDSGVLSIAEVEVFGTVPSREVEAIAHWPLDEGSGSIAHDISGNGFDGTVSNAIWTVDQLGGALDFNGSNSVVYIPGEAFDSIENEITVSLWVYGADAQPRVGSAFGAFDASDKRVLNIHLPYSDSNIYWDAGYSSGGYDRIYYPTDSDDQFKGQWNHWVFTKNAVSGTMQIYLNGALWNNPGSGKTKTITGIIQGTIGANVPGGHFYDGMIGDVKLYNLELTEEEVNTLYLDGDLHVPMFDSGVNVSGGTFNAQFYGTVGSGYRVEWTPNLTSSWETVTNIGSLESSPFSMAIPASNNAGFYRIIWNP